MGYKTFSLQDWSVTSPETFNSREQYVERVRPLVDALVEACKALDLPCMVTISVAQDETGSNIDMTSHFPALERTPISILCGMLAIQGDLLQMQQALIANGERMEKSKATKH